MKAELLFGAYRSTRRETNLWLLETLFGQFVSLPFDDGAAEHYGRIQADLAVKGRPIGGGLKRLKAMFVYEHPNNAVM